MECKPGIFSGQSLLELLNQAPETGRFWVGYSGGVDSTALLLALQELGDDLKADLQAVHFNHGLQGQADQWQKECESFCHERSIELKVFKLDLANLSGRSQEECARQERYKVVETLLDQNDIYLTAHHADDNAETLFMNLMRGSGVDGLAAIPPIRECGEGWVARPLLGFHRKDLEQYLQSRGVDWSEDPSNQDPVFDRNYIRHHLFPELEKRWAGVTKRLSHSASHIRDFTEATSAVIKQQHSELFADSVTMPFQQFIRQEPGLRSIVLRQWLKDQGILLPPKRRLQEFIKQLAQESAASNQPELRWAGWQIKRNADKLWLHELPCPDTCPCSRWGNSMTADLGESFGLLVLKGQPQKMSSSWQIGPKRKGAQIRLHHNGPGKKVKELMRVLQIPPWLRNGVPVLYIDNEVAAIGDVMLSADFRNFLNQQSLTFSWSPGHPLLCKLQSVSVPLPDGDKFNHDQ
jgi:tRNA(Ile)-lysidine synthase